VPDEQPATKTLSPPHPTPHTLSAFIHHSTRTYFALIPCPNHSTLRGISLSRQETNYIVFVIRLEFQKSSKSTRSPWRNGSALDFYLTSSGHPKAAGSSPAGDAFLLLLSFCSSFYHLTAIRALLGGGGGWCGEYNEDGRVCFCRFGLGSFFSSVWEAERVLQVTGMRRRKNIAALSACVV
jgi:hypothetical protein